MRSAVCAVNDSAEADGDALHLSEARTRAAARRNGAPSPDKDGAASAASGGLRRPLPLPLEEWRYNLAHFPGVLAMKESGESS